MSSTDLSPASLRAAFGHFPIGVVAIAVAFALTRDWRIAIAIGLIEPAAQTVAYFIH